MRETKRCSVVSCEKPASYVVMQAVVHNPTTHDATLTNVFFCEEHTAQLQRPYEIRLNPASTASGQA